ncbi:hypothetical protein NFI96_018228 [Prochilodus magdalenae]|nr:hypothetical protein NFI96_018228 [Prochilodus magdalenae]
MWALIVWMLVLPLSLGQKVEQGCQDWNIVGQNVCCNRCKPGNWLVTRCGPKPETLCRVCDNGSYVTDGSEPMCKKCRECIGKMKVKQACTASSNTVCECTEGLRCGNDQCAFCTKECGKGEQPTADRACQPCPQGTFNNKIHQMCVKWSSRCPSPDQKIIANGTAFSDVVCGPADDHKPTMPFPDVKPTKSPPNNKDDYSWTMLVIAIVCAFLIAVAAVPLFTALTCKRVEKLKAASRTAEAPAGQRLMPEPEQCSFCFPQEERGSSSEVSLVSDDKPFELVV